MSCAGDPHAPTRPPQVLVLARLTAGPRPLSLFLWAFPLRALSGLVQVWLVYALPDRTLEPWSASTVPWSYAALIFAVTNLHGFVQTAMFMSQISFFTRVAALSPLSGGAVMTFLNTMANLGSMWISPLVLVAIDKLTSRSCTATIAAGRDGLPPPDTGLCSSHDGGAAGAAACAAAGGACVTARDGFAIVTALSTLYCAVWWLTMRSTVTKLQDSPPEAWNPALVQGHTTVVRPAQQGSTQFVSA